jgi:hypothetical protein
MTRETWELIGLGTLLPLALVGAVIAAMGSWDRFPPSQRIPAAGAERIARRRRLAWASVVAVLLAPSYVFTPFLAVAIAPLAFLVRAQLAISRLQAPGVCVFAGERHVVIVCRGANAIWLRATPQQVAQCAMPRATIVRA